MASKAVMTPLLRNVVKRGYAQVSPAVREAKLDTKTVGNTIITALDNGSAVTRVTVAFKAGSRYEPSTDIGVSHVVRAAAGLTTGKSSGFITARKIAQFGGALQASGDREFIYYTLESSQESINETIECLINMVSAQEFRPWEVSELSSKLHYDIASLTPQVRAVDLLHKAAFRRDLGNSLWIQPRRVGHVSSETLQHYAGSHLTLDRCAISVVGDCLDRAALIAQNLKMSECGGTPTKSSSKYYGGELRKEMGGDLAHVAIALQGAVAGSQGALALAVASRALGCGPVTKWGADNSVLGQKMGNIGPYAAAGFNVSYSDSGLFGVVMSVPAAEAQNALKTVVGILKSGKLSDQAIQTGKNQLKLQILSEADSGLTLSESLAAQALTTGSVRSPNDLAAEIDNISSSDVNSALGSAASSELSIGAVGNLAYTPYRSEIGK